MTLILAASVLLADELGPGWVVLEEGRIAAAGRDRPPAAPDLELADGLLAPGLVDLQVNGAVGHDFAGADVEGWKEVMAWLPSTGVTAFVPTVITAPLDDLAASLRRFASSRAELDASAGAQPLGVHVEGPFLAASRRGAHRADLLVDPTALRIEQLLAAGGDDLLYVTLAPERSDALAAIATLVEAGVRVSVGHSDATDEQVRAAADAGASLVTHLYNAQRPLHHRDPGVVGAALTDARLTVGLIADLHHAAPTAVAVAFAAAVGRIALVSDAVAALGMPPGRYELGGEEVHVPPDGSPPVRTDGTLAGSTLRLDEAVRNTIACGIDPAVALTAATRVPADAVGRPELGRLAPGARADLTWLDDGGGRARATWVAGRLAWTRDDAGPLAVAGGHEAAAPRSTT